MEFKDWLDELMARTDIAKVVSAYTPLTKKGATFWGCCPFHHEKTPSFTVNSERGLFHCFGCKEGGNVISFLKKIESIDFSEAIRILAKSANMEPPPPMHGEKTDEVALAKKRERLYKLMREAARHYHENLKLPQAQKATAYLKKRQIDERMATRFGIGYSVDGKEMPKYLEKLGYTKVEMREAGLAAQRADEWYDVFFGRLMIPIINNYGEVVAFGGRVLEEKVDFAKYRNSSQTLIFDKSRTLYAANLLKKRKQAAPIAYVIMTEGYMDVISLHNAGFDTAVASMGTALTYSQAKQLKNFCNNIYISYDGDSAGQKATLRGLDILAEAGLYVKVISLPDGMDPDDVIKKQGSEAYQKLIDSAQTLPAFKLSVLRKQYDVAVPEQKSQFAVEAIKVIKQLKNPVEQEDYLKSVHKETGYSMDALLKQAEITVVSATGGEATPLNAKTHPSPNFAPESGEKAKLKKAENFVLASVLNRRDYVRMDENLYPLLSDDFSRKIYQFCVTQIKDGVENMSMLYNEVSESDCALLEELMHYNFLASDTQEKYLDSILTLKIAALEKEKMETSKIIDEKKDYTLLTKIQELENKLKRLKNGTSEED